MDYKKHIEKAVEYIEENLKNDIDIRDCAKAAGYSKYHFGKIFMETVKLSPADYIRKRRITEIVKKLSANRGNISEIAFEYGFNSKENFTRAFVREHRILPTEYKKAQNSLKLYERADFEADEFGVTPYITDVEGFELIGYKSDESLPPNFWNIYNSRKYSLRLTGGRVCEDYGVSMYDGMRGKLDYFIGVRAENSCGDISGTMRLGISGGLYAVFETPPSTHYSFVNTIQRTWDYINNAWQRQTEYERATGHEFEVYLEQSRTFSEKIFVPIKTRGISNEKA